MKCPKDGTELQAKNYEADITVDSCDACGGMWLDDGELERIQEVKENDYSHELERMPDLGVGAYALAEAKTDRSLSCPKCGADMEVLEYARSSQVLIDTCTKCEGVWLDMGEVRELEVFFERARGEARGLRQEFFASLRSLFGR